MAMGITRVADQYGYLAAAEQHRESLAAVEAEARQIATAHHGYSITAGRNDPRRIQRQAADAPWRSDPSFEETGDPEHDAMAWRAYQKHLSEGPEAPFDVDAWADQNTESTNRLLDRNEWQVGRGRNAARRMQRQAMPVPRGTDPLFTPRQEGGEHGDIYRGDGDWFSDYGQEPDAEDRARWQDLTRQRNESIQQYIDNTGLDPYVPEWQAREEKAERERNAAKGDFGGKKAPPFGSKDSDDDDDDQDDDKPWYED